jgi:hypothetical protein
VGSFNYLNPGLLNPPQHLPDGALFSVPFIDGDDVTGHSPLTLLVKASIQLERTMAFTARNPGIFASPLSRELKSYFRRRNSPSFTRVLGN